MAHAIFSSLKRRLYARFNHRIDNPKDRKRSAFFAEWIDVGFLRHRWTNDGKIAPGVFRANHPDEKRFKSYVKSGIRTVVNLRNDIERSPSKFAEERTLANGMLYVSYPLFPRRAPTKVELLGLIDLLPTLQKPILFHCKSGADRTGLTAAIWLLTQENKSLELARKELSLQYIHRRDSETGVLDEILDAYQLFEAELDFRQWVDKHYDPLAAEKSAEAKKPNRRFWGTLRHFYRDIYTYAQHREILWHDSFAKAIETENDRKRARFFMTWIDHGILRSVWKNFHEVGHGVFRSNHPTEKRFRRYANKGFKTIINLRGASMLPQYQLELALCKELNLKLIDIGLEGGSAPPKESLLELLDAFESAEKPLIVHCKSGADRTGLAAALFRLSVGESVESAKKELSLRFLHLKDGGKGVLDWVIDQYAVENAVTPITLRHWVETKYDPVQLTRGFHALRKNGSFVAKPTVAANGSPTKKIAIITSVRNDASFLDRWIEYYGSAFGSTSLFVILDGFDQQVPNATGVNFIRVPFVQRNVVAGDKARAKRASNLAETLFHSFDIVIGTDVDEFIAIDPKLRKTLPEYLSEKQLTEPLSPLGMDVAQHLEYEGPIEESKPFLNQRRYAKISDRYTKASILNGPLRWGSGYHRVRGENFKIDPHLFLFHFGSVDQSISANRAVDEDRIAEGWASHQKRRDALFDEISKSEAVDGDLRFKSARTEMARKRKWHAWNKPGALKNNAIVKIPGRFRNLF
ncbi:MAG: tyrosine-protein phosphatase [Paracoccaceae bacterium]|nr:tyrosine-protein phosphatase [Paracoccaceae bacterium]MDG2259012.1 tyrosine-protein phosphatase [Paracoccaceae bacterium]